MSDNGGAGGAGRQDGRSDGLPARGFCGGRYQPLAQADVLRMHNAALDIWDYLTVA